MARFRRDGRDTTGGTYIVKWDYPGYGEWSRSVKSIGNRPAKQVAQAAAQRVEKRIRLVKEGDVSIPAHIVTKKQMGAFLYNESTAMTPTTVEVDSGGIADLVSEYLDSRSLMVTLREKKGIRKGGLSMGSYSSDKYRLQNFLKHCKNSNKTQVSSVVTSDFLREYRDKILKAVASNRKSDADGKHHLRTVKAFLLWVFEQERVDSLPRNLLSKGFARVEIQAPAPEFFSLKEVRSLFNAANDRLRLHILMGLNCGYTQSDISSLTHDMVDFERGLIRRNRQKTGVQSEHKLWSVTLTLLKRFATDPNTHTSLLLNQNGNVLVQERRKKDGGIVKTDSIKLAFNRLRKKTQIKLSFKCLRKTGANKIEQQYPEHPHLAKLYLSHETQGIQKHYTGRTFSLLHTATDWLEGYFDLSDSGTLEGSGGLNSQ